MAARALIIAVESYPSAPAGIARELPGTLQAATGFKDWLTEKWRAEGRADNDTQILFCSDPPTPGGSGATSTDIFNALQRIKRDGQRMTDELYFFFSGHGFSFVESPGSHADVLVCSDFGPGPATGRCFSLGEIVFWLRSHLGPSLQYFFIDACRNKLDATQIQVGKFLPFDSQTTVEASTFVLQSTVEGATAAAASTFTSELIAALRGKGRAKGWDRNVRDAMVVNYELLHKHVAKMLETKQAITTENKGTVPASDAIIVKIRPIPMCECTIEIADATPQDTGDLLLARNRSDPVSRPLSSVSFSLQLQPDDYSIAVRLQGAAVDPGQPVAVELFQDQTVRFRKVPPTGPPTRDGGRGPGPDTLRDSLLANVNVVLAAGTRLTLLSLDAGTKASFTSSGETPIAPGRYLATLEAGGEAVFARRSVDLAPGQTCKLDLGDWSGSVPHEAIAKRLPTRIGAVEFSESMQGAPVDSDLGVWLAILGGGRIIGSCGRYTKIAAFPLHDFRAEPAHASPIYVLAGFEDAAVRLRVSLSDTPGVWTEAPEPPEMPGIRHAHFAARAGPTLVSFRVNEAPPYTVASLASPNRGTLITLTLDEAGTPRIGQYLLPLGHLFEHLPDAVREQVTLRNHLRDVHFLAQANRAFRKRRDLSTEVSDHQLAEMLGAKWLDPIATCMAAYELLRRGKEAQLRVVIANLKRFFPDVPDTAAIAKLSGEAMERAPGVPLFLDGVKAFAEDPDWLPLPAGHLDFSSAWTAWLAVAPG